MKRTLPGINIQFPISQLILNGKKTVETRTYTLPEKYVHQDLYLVETPGDNGIFRARIIAIIQFGKPFLYESKREFYKDIKRHNVNPESLWAWQDKPKWGWPIVSLEKLKSPQVFNGVRGIRFTKKISLSI